MAFLGITSKNGGQKKASALLLNDKPFLFLTGKAGTGKTLITEAAGLYRTLEREQFNKLIYTRMQTQLGEDQGFLPGDLTAKTYPFVRPFFDNLELMDLKEKHKNAITGDEEKRKVFFDPIQTFRGASFHRSFIMIDEAQNLDVDTIAGIASRIGFGSKMVFLGNFSQIDIPKLRKPENNGLYKLLDGLYQKEADEYFDHLTLTEQERNPVVDIVEEILRNNSVDARFETLEDLGAI